MGKNQGNPGVSPDFEYPDQAYCEIPTEHARQENEFID
jgi:hypothetical protein